MERRYVGNEFTYGPEVRAAGLIVDGQKHVFEEASANYLEITATGEGLSCPFLYAWNDEALQWQSYGKVIHEARGKNRKMTQVIALNGLITKFRLSEEEPERSFIDKVELRLLMRDGFRVTIKSTTKELERIDANYVRIPPYQSVVFEFQMPEAIDTASVDKASLAITGYYERVRAQGLAGSSRAAPDR